MALDFGGETLRVRRVTLALDAPTRGGDAEVHGLTNLTGAQAKAARVAGVDRKRWPIKDRFSGLATTPDGEANTPGDPGAMFAFGLALVASNAVAVWRATHGAEAVGSMSRHSVAVEVRRTYAGMVVALPPESWEVFRGLGTVAGVLRELAGRVTPGDYRKATRGAKKPPAATGRSKSGGHVATQRLVDRRKRPVS